MPADDSATYQLLTGPSGQEYLRQISSHDWDDKGAAAAATLSWIARDAQSADATAAQRAGEAAHAIATFLADNKDELLQLSAGWFGLQHRAVGQLNPALVKGYASALIPFQGAIVGDVKPMRGFEIIGDGIDLSSARNVFAVIDTNTEAGKTFNEFNEAAHQRVRGYLRTYAAAAVSKDVGNLVDLQHAADLAGVLAGGQRMSGNSAIDTRRAQYWINWAGYELAAAMGARPGGPDIPDQYFTPDGRLKAPDQVSANDLDGFVTALDIFTFNHGFPGLGSDFQRWYDDAAGK
jgi:hypothetical protein